MYLKVLPMAGQTCDCLEAAPQDADNLEKGLAV